MVLLSKSGSNVDTWLVGDTIYNIYKIKNADTVDSRNCSEFTEHVTATVR